jgi:polyisoprenoid-binding protein YceI
MKYPMRRFLLTLLWANSSAFAADNLTIDASHSAVIFSWNHFGFSNPVARLEKIQGNLALDSRDLTQSSVSVTMPLSGLRTGDADLDKRLKSDEFLDAEKYPNITFTSKQVADAGQGALTITGDLTVHGVTKTVVLKAKVDKIGVHPLSHAPTAGFDADTVLRRSDFGVSKYVPAMTDELFVHISLGADLR